MLFEIHTEHGRVPGFPMCLAAAEREASRIIRRGVPGVCIVATAESRTPYGAAKESTTHPFTRGIVYPGGE